MQNFPFKKIVYTKISRPVDYVPKKKQHLIEFKKLMNVNEKVQVKQQTLKVIKRIGTSNLYILEKV